MFTISLKRTKKVKWYVEWICGKTHIGAFKLQDLNGRYMVISYIYIFFTFLYVLSFHNKMLGKNLNGGLQAENSVFIPDTLLLSTEVLPGIICSGEVTGNNGNCCLFHHSDFSKIPERGFSSGEDPLAVGQSGAASGEASICGRQEHSFLVY